MVLSHKDPEQVERLVKAILTLHSTARVFVQHDARSSHAPTISDPRVLVREHHRQADWGSWELVLATLDALTAATTALNPDLLVLVSGQDYPARNLEKWATDFIDSGGGWIGDVQPLRYTPRWGRKRGGGDDDLTRYIYKWYRLPFGGRITESESRFARASLRLLWKVSHYVEPVLSIRNVARGSGLHVGIRSFRGPFSGGTLCYKGSQWLALDRQHLIMLLARHASDKRLSSAYRRSIIPDESYLQTILMSVGPPQRPPVTYVDWSVAKSPPKVLDLEDLRPILTSGSAFCRKVECGTSDSLMDCLDRIAPSQ